MFPGSAFGNTRWNGNSKGYSKDNEIVLHCRCKCHTSDPVFPATRYFQRQSHDGLDSRPLWQATYCVFAGEFAGGMRLEIRYPHREPPEDEEHIDLDSKQLTFFTRKKRKMPQARGDSLPQLIQSIRRQLFGELPNTQHMPELWKMDNSTLPIQ